MSGTKETRYAIHFKGSYISNNWRSKGQTFEVDGYYPTNTSPNREVKFTNDLTKAKTWKTLATAENAVQKVLAWRYPFLEASVVEVEVEIRTK